MEGANVVWPSNVTSFPSCYIDRQGDVLDPYHGTASGWEMGIEQDWLDRSEVIFPASIDVEASLSEDGSTVEVASHTTFVVATTDEYTIGYALLADGLTGTGTQWEQSNALTGGGDYYPGEDFEVFTNGGSTVRGLEFNDVVILSPDIAGAAGSLPDEIAAGQEYGYKRRRYCLYTNKGGN